MKIPQVTIRHLPTHKDDPEPYRASIFCEDIDHHGIGASPSEALIRATLHWRDYKVSKEMEAGRHD